MKTSPFDKTKWIGRWMAALLVLFFEGAMMAQAPQNDNCFSTPNLFTLSCGTTLAGSTINATADNVPNCGGAGAAGIGVWYMFNGNGKTVTFGTCDDNTDFDTKISVYTGSCGSLTCVAGNDNFCGNRARVSINTVSGTLYRILVHGANGTTGNFAIRVLCNETCSGPIALMPGQAVLGSNIGAGAESPFPPNCNTTDGTASDVWYSFIGNGTTATVSTCNSTGFDTQLSVFTGACGSLNCVAANDDFCGNKSQVSFATTYGTGYKVRVNGKNNAQGVFNLSLTFSPPANDLCANATLVACGSSTDGTTAGATAETSPECGVPLSTSPGVWYRFVGNGGIATVSTCNLFNQNFDTKIRVFSGSCTNLLCVAGNDDGVHCNGGSRTNFQTTAGTTYRILVNGALNESGNFTLSVSCGTPLIGGNGTEAFDASGEIAAQLPNALPSFQLFPNPTSNGEVHLRMPPLPRGDKPEAQEASLEIRNLLGQPVLRRSFGRVDGLEEKVDLSGLGNGIYLATLWVSNQRATQRLVISSE